MWLNRNMLSQKWNKNTNLHKLSYIWFHKRNGPPMCGVLKKYQLIILATSALYSECCGGSPAAQSIFPMIPLCHSTRYCAHRLAGNCHIVWPLSVRRYCKWPIALCPAQVMNIVLAYCYWTDWDSILIEMSYQVLALHRFLLMDKRCSASPRYRALNTGRSGCGRKSHNSLSLPEQAYRR